MDGEVMKWFEIVKDRRYIDASPQRKRFIQEDWFKRTIESDPRYTPEQETEIKTDIFGGERLTYTAEERKEYGELRPAEPRLTERIAEKLPEFLGGAKIETSPETYKVERLAPARKMRSFLYGTEKPRFDFEYRYDEPAYKKVPRVTLQVVEDILDVVALPIILINLGTMAARGLKQDVTNLRNVIRYLRTKAPSEAEYFSKFTPEAIGRMNKEAEAYKALKRANPAKAKELYKFMLERRIIPLAERLAKGEPILGKEAKFPVALEKALAPLKAVPKAVPPITGLPGLSDQGQLKAVIKGDKPILLTGTESPDWKSLVSGAKKAGLKSIVGKAKPFARDEATGKVVATVKDIVIYPEKNAKQALEALKLVQARKKVMPEYHRKLGRLLGYTEEEIESFIKPEVAPAVVPKAPVVSKIEVTPKHVVVEGKVKPTAYATKWEMEEALNVKLPHKPSTKYLPNSVYNTSYKTPDGIIMTLMSGEKLNEIDSMLQANQIPTGTLGEQIIGIVDTFPVKGDAGATGIFNFEDAYTNLTGTAEKLTSKFKHLSKKVGTPFFIGQKYPSFKPVYTAVQDAIDYKNELFWVGQSILQPQKLAKLPAPSHEKLANIVRLGNSAEIRRWYNDEELTIKFEFNPEEVVAYGRLRKLYEHATKMEVKARKTLMGYEAMSPAKKLIADELIYKQVAKLGGYVSQTRLGGQWAVYAPPDVEGETARFFNLYRTKSEALKAKEMLGPGATAYLRDETVQRGFYKHLTLADLESLIEASDVDTRSPDLEALRTELKRRSFSAHWIKRRDIPGYEWTWTNILESSVDYLEGASNKLSRVVGRANAEIAFKGSVGEMTPEIRAYARDFMDLFYGTGSIGIRALNRLMYGWKLAFKTSWLAQNLTQPIAVTYPALAKHFTGLKTERVFLASYDQAWRYFYSRWKGTPHGISTELVSLLDKLHKQGVLGDQMTRFQLAVRNLAPEELEKWMGLFGRIGEGINRTHAAIAGYRVATEVKGLTDKGAKLEFMKEFVGETQFFYGKHNLPQVVTGAGGWRNLARTMYTFRHYLVSYIQKLNSMMPWRDAPRRQTARALGALLFQAGVKGLPFMALVALGYKYIKGRTLDHDARKMMTDAEVPTQVQDMILGGVWSMMGIDASMLVGVGDIVPTFGSMMERVVGAPAGMVSQLWKGVVFAERGDYDRALEQAPPDFIRNVMRARRYAQEGIRKMSGELVATPTKLDVFLRALGFSPLGEAKGYAAREAKAAMLRKQRRTATEYYQALAEALLDKDYEGYGKLIAEARSKGIKLEKAGVKRWMQKRRGIDVGVPRKLRREFREVDKLFGVK